MELLQADDAFARSDAGAVAFDSHDFAAPSFPKSAAPISSPAPAWERARYEPSRASHGPAAAASLLFVGGLLAAFLTLNMAGGHHHKHSLVTVSLQMPPPPPVPQQQAPRPAAAKHDQPQVVAPPPMVVLTKAPTVMTAPTPTPKPAPLSVAPAPAAPTLPAAPAGAPSPRAMAKGGDLSTKMISAKPPTYPLDSRRKHEQGTVVLNVVLSDDGLVSDISVAHSSGFDRLDQAALAAVRKWRWAPTVRDGEPVMVQGEVSIPFVLTH